jgi:hypothetical protein
MCSDPRCSRDSVEIVSSNETIKYSRSGLQSVYFVLMHRQSVAYVLLLEVFVFLRQSLYLPAKRQTMRNDKSGFGNLKVYMAP